MIVNETKRSKKVSTNRLKSLLVLSKKQIINFNSLVILLTINVDKKPIILPINIHQDNYIVICYNLLNIIMHIF